jgi:hypothetical protein
MKAALLALCLPLTSLAVAAPATCTAEAHATERTDDVRDESVGKVFAVQIDTQESCARVDVDFTATERLSDGEEIKVRQRGSRKVKPGTTYKVSYRVAPGSELLDTEFKVVRCVPCGE